MSWFTSYVEHPFVSAFAKLEASPAVKGNASVQSAVSTVKSQAVTVASVTDSSVHQVVASAAAAADPTVDALGTGLIAAVDAYLTACGPAGSLATPVANALIAMGENYAHGLLASLFAHAKATQAAAVAATATGTQNTPTPVVVEVQPEAQAA